MPDEEFGLNEPEDFSGGAPSSKGVEAPGDDSGMPDPASTNPRHLRVTRDASSATIGFNEIDVPDELFIAGYRDQVFRLLQQHPECRVITFDFTGIKLVPSGMLGLLASVKKQGRDVEVLNPSPFVRDTLRITRLDTLLKIRTTM